jgi:hypothetical protein
MESNPQFLTFLSILPATLARHFRSFTIGVTDDEAVVCNLIQRFDASIWIDRHWKDDQMWRRLK